jgi:hypothetical protein
MPTHVGRETSAQAPSGGRRLAVGGVGTEAAERMHRSTVPHADDVRGQGGRVSGPTRSCALHHHVLSRPREGEDRHAGGEQAADDRAAARAVNRSRIASGTTVSLLLPGADGTRSQGRCRRVDFTFSIESLPSTSRTIVFTWVRRLSSRSPPITPLSSLSLSADAPRARRRIVHHHHPFAERLGPGIAG